MLPPPKAILVLLLLLAYGETFPIRSLLDDPSGASPQDHAALLASSLSGLPQQPEVGESAANQALQGQGVALPVASFSDGASPPALSLPALSSQTGLPSEVENAAVNQVKEIPGVFAPPNPSPDQAAPPAQPTQIIESGQLSSQAPAGAAEATLDAANAQPAAAQDATAGALPPNLMFAAVANQVQQGQPPSPEGASIEAAPPAEPLPPSSVSGVPQPQQLPPESAVNQVRQDLAAALIASSTDQAALPPQLPAQDGAAQPGQLSSQAPAFAADATVDANAQAAAVPDTQQGAAGDYAPTAFPPPAASTDQAALPPIAQNVCIN